MFVFVIIPAVLSWYKLASSIGINGTASTELESLWRWSIEKAVALGKLMPTAKAEFVSVLCNV